MTNNAADPKERAAQYLELLQSGQPVSTRKLREIRLWLKRAKRESGRQAKVPTAESRHG